jgi:ribonuclease HII
MSIEKIKIDYLKKLLNNCSFEEFLTIKDELKSDVRKNIQALLMGKQKKYDNEAKLLEEYKKRSIYEMKLLKDNYKFIAGIDEVGRGPLAGPVYTAAVILDPSINILGIKDSKKLSEKQREVLSEEIKQKCLCYSIGIASEEEIDKLNILNATKLAMKRAVEGLSIKPEYLLIDALRLKDIDIPQIDIIRGDDLSISIGAASIVAKVERDNFMIKVSEKYAGYKFESNKGYGSSEHIEALKKFGPCEIHRKSFIKNFI